MASTLLEDDGQLVAISPRSFCNGPYFEEFRKKLLSRLSIHRVHVFNSRTATFEEESVVLSELRVRAA